MHLYEVLRRPIITEKTTLLQGQNKYVFAVATAANKAQIKEAVEQAFNVTVKAVNVQMVPGKVRLVFTPRSASAPAAASAAIQACFAASGITVLIDWSPSRGPTSTMRTRLGMVMDVKSYEAATEGTECTEKKPA